MFETFRSELFVYHFWLFIHLLGLVVMAAGVGVANVSGIMASKTKEPKLIAMWSGLNHRIEHIAILPGALTLLIAGTVLVDRQGYDFGALWISAAYGLWIVAVILGAGVLGRHSKRINRAAVAEMNDGVEVSVEAARLASLPVGPIVGNLLNVIILVFLYLMIVKPS